MTSDCFNKEKCVCPTDLKEICKDPDAFCYDKERCRRDVDKCSETLDGLDNWDPDTIEEYKKLKD